MARLGADAARKAEAGCLGLEGESPILHKELPDFIAEKGLCYVEYVT
jgi:hypothetical protein